MNLVVTGGVDPRHIFPQRFFLADAPWPEGISCSRSERSSLEGRWQGCFGSQVFNDIIPGHTQSQKKKHAVLTRFLLLWNQRNSAWNRLQAQSNRQGPTNSERSSLGVTHSITGQTRISSLVVGVPFLEFHFCIMGWACKRSHNMECIGQRTASKALYMFFSNVSITLQFSQDRSTWLTLKPFPWKTPQDQLSSLWFLGWLFCLLPSPWHHLPRIIWPHVHTKRCATSWQHYFRHHGLGTPLELVI